MAGGGHVGGPFLGQGHLVQFPHASRVTRRSASKIRKDSIYAGLLGEGACKAKGFDDTFVDPFKHFDDGSPAAYGGGAKFT
ncbi:hypothetical protein [Novosphingobium album (ex Hu et al. 2023)]|uniref:Uncharacterized protein n=1 Tax=Novosphingobium album (ex Hu et al. 2023) TaxID=2930093 RepID=A0ABT0B497_9SPHN|nr:hypothetical protein [Novosphingobium album (ex Hu et al. 2023)]MCJ2179892.1 hypothetical protein [Novosphingobium album (ex Hu et al. 2023)]